MTLIFWIITFIASVAVLVKSADYFTEASEKIGLVLKISPFIIGVTIVSIGTSLPELAGSLAAVFKNETSIVVANVIGSNIANILLIVGLTTLAARQLVVKRSLIDLDIPLLALITVMITMIILDGSVVWLEAILLIIAYFVYSAYLFKSYKERKAKEGAPKKELVEEDILKELPSRYDRRKRVREITKFNLSLFGIFIISAIGIYFGANYTIESVIKIADILNIATSTIAITAIAIGTSLPELVVSIGAALKRKYEIALGNIFGSNIFNSLIVIGLPALFKTLEVDNVVLTVGLPFLLIATFVFIISGISKRIHNWEGAMYLLIYVLFIAKLFGLF